jgi:hypothetical protein
MRTPAQVAAEQADVTPSAKTVFAYNDVVSALVLAGHTRSAAEAAVNRLVYAVRSDVHGEYTRRQR